MKTENIGVDTENAGIDLGYGAIKIATNENTSQLQSFLSTVTKNLYGAMDGVKRSAGPIRIDTEDGSFYVGPNAHSYGAKIDSLDYDRLLGGFDIKALTLAALAAHGISGKMTAMVGLPLALLSEDNAKENASKVRKWMVGTHEFSVNGEQCKIDIDKVIITSQPIGAMMDYILNDDGTQSPNFKNAKKELGILSVGFNTIEMLTLEDGKIVESLSDSSTNGVRRLLSMCDPNRWYSLGEMDDRLRSGKLDLSEMKPQWAAKVNNDIEYTWGEQWQRFHRILAVGGGSIILNGELDQYRMKMHHPEDPVFSIAKGLLKNLNRKAK